MFSLYFETNNDAFGTDQYDMNNECARILNKISDQLRSGKTEGYIYDLNGNKIGEWGGSEVEYMEEYEDMEEEYLIDEL